MLNSVDFIKCIRDNLKDRRFGKQKADEIVNDFEAREKAYKQQGYDSTTAGIHAMKDTFDNLSEVAAEKAKRTAKMLSVQAENNARIAQGLNINTSIFDTKDGPKTSRGKALARAAISLIEDDPRFSGLSYSTVKETTRGQLFAIMNDVLEKAGKGAFGMQKGKAHLPNIVREVFGENTGDVAAKDMAAAWTKTSDTGVDLFNQAGGSLKKLSRYLPQPGHNIAKLVRDEAKWFATRADRWDWDKMRWPDGTIIPEYERPGVIKAVYETMSTDGANKIDPTSFRGRGQAMGNMLDNHRFVHYKNAQAWLDDLKDFGDGSVFDVMASHIEHMSHKIAMVDVFGPNPDMTFNNIEAIVKKQAAGLSAKDRAEADAVLKNTLSPMLDIVSRTNPMNPESVWGASMVATSNILTSAQLGSATLLAMPGDFMQTIAVRALNKMDLFGGIDFYFKALATDKKFMREIATQSGFVMDETVMATYATTRFSGMATVGPQWSRRVADTIMRASLMSGHTRAARAATQMEFMGVLNRMSSTKFDDLPFVEVMKRYGISEKEWDDFRANVSTHSPAKDVAFLRPIDVLNTKLSNKQTLYKKFQGMVFEESRKMVPEATIEGTVTLKGTTRPDTLMGTIMHSFAMYKNFPISFYMIYGRLGLASPNVKGRLGFYAGLGAGMTMVGAIGTQMREVAKGNDPLPMDTPAFWGKAFLSGGALSIWGDFLFSGVNNFGQGPADVVGGPLAGFLGDTTNLALGDVFKWADSVGSLDYGTKDSQTAPKLVEYLRRYTPGSNVWWARLALERQVWDRLQEIADPKAYSKRRRKEANQKRRNGNESWWPAGQRTPERLPQYQGKD